MRVTAAVITILALAVVPCIAADGGAAATVRQVPPGQQMNQVMMPTPSHLLMRAYHRNVANFAETLYQAAERGPSVPAPLARTAVAEMRRSVEEMEKQRATALAEMRLPPQRQKMMDEHLVQVKTHLRQLEELVQKERIESGQVKKELQSIFMDCGGAGCGAGPGPLGRQGQGAYGGMPGCDCRAGNPDHAMMMDDMMEKVKRQDAELAQLVQRMRQASGQAKVDLVAETVATMVQQRAELTEDMEKMHDMMQWQHPGTDQMMNDEEDQDQGQDEEYDLEDEEDVTTD